jgi:hypothetical protein
MIKKNLLKPRIQLQYLSFLPLFPGPSMELLSSLSPDREGEGGGVFTPVSHALFVVLYITFIHMAVIAPH